MPSFRDHVETLERWRRLGGRERLDDERVAMTFDDGPDPAGTPAVLEALETVAVTATFFMVGEQASAHPELAREVARRGHEVALHGSEHVRGGGDLGAGLETLERVTGARATRFRPPYGWIEDDTPAACAQLGLELVLWSAWGLDWEPIGAERIADLARRDLVPGAILVLHNSARYAPRADAGATAEALPAVTAAARERGLEVGPL